MAISRYENNGKELFRVYVQARGKNDKSIRIQKLKTGFESFSVAAKAEKKLIKLVTEEVATLEGRGLKWDEILRRWEICARYGHLGDKYQNPLLIMSHVNRLHRYTNKWFDKVASDLTKGDGRFVLNIAKSEGAKEAVLKKIKSSINVVFKWAIEEKYIVNTNSSPVEGINVLEKSEKVPKILTLEEVKMLLSEAKKQGHPWYHIWAFALLTGMRSGELLALQWSDIDFEKNNIRVSKSYCHHSRAVKSTKAGYWRNVPISSELHEIIHELKHDNEANENSYVLPRIKSWANGDGGMIIREFLKEIGIDKPVVFHTLRACFATHLLALGAETAKIMKIGGWRDFKSFQIYVRLAGIEVSGVTDALHLIPRVSEKEVHITDNVLNMYKFS